MSVSLEIDAFELVAFARAAEAAPERLQTDLRTATQALGAEGVSIMQEHAPVMDGTLRNSIQLISSTMDGMSVEFGTSMIYAFQREYGGTITPKKGDYLWFEVNGKLVRAKSVTQEGAFYARSTVNELNPLVYLTYQKVVNKIINDLGLW